MWIAFLIPKIEDGNNFGVSVQVSSYLNVGECYRPSGPLVCRKLYKSIFVMILN